MRLWSIHPRYLDRAGLVALWREGLLAQAVLAGKTRGYRHHPQLQRFREHARPLDAIAQYLHVIAREAERRGYSFDRSKLPPLRRVRRAPVTEGQLRYEWRHLKAKLRVRDRAALLSIREVETPLAHPSFSVVEGPVADWERR